MFRANPILKADRYHAARGEVMRVWNELRHHGYIPESTVEVQDGGSRCGGGGFRKKHMSDQIEPFVVYVNVGGRGFQELFVP